MPSKESAKRLEQKAKKKTKEPKGPVSKPEKGSEIRRMVHHTDLCATCAHADFCINRKGHDLPVYYCEEYDSIETPVEYKPTPVMEGKQPRELMAICATCDRRETCTIARSQTGIWHCEDYC